MSATVKPPVWFWVVAVLGLLFTLYGGFIYYTYQTSDAAAFIEAGFTEEQAAYVLNAPVWVSVIFALAVWSGLLGAILLLLRKGWAASVLMFSAAMVLINIIAGFVSGGYDILGSSAIIQDVVILLVMVILAWFARMSKAKGWIG